MDVWAIAALLFAVMCVYVIWQLVTAPLLDDEWPLDNERQPTQSKKRPQINYLESIEPEQTVRELIDQR